VTGYYEVVSADAFRESIDDIHQRIGGRLEVAAFDKTATNPEAPIGDAIARFSDRAPRTAAFAPTSILTLGQIG